MRPTIAIAAVSLLLSGCDSPPAQQVQDENLVDATLTDQAYPSAAGGNQAITGTAAGDTAPAAPTGDVPGSAGTGSGTPSGGQTNQTSSAPANSQ